MQLATQMNRQALASTYMYDMQHKQVHNMSSGSNAEPDQAIILPTGAGTGGAAAPAPTAAAFGSAASNDKAKEMVKTPETVSTDGTAAAVLASICASTSSIATDSLTSTGPDRITRHQSSNASSISSNSGKETFPQILMDLLNSADTDPQISEAITWLPSGEAFKVIDQKIFVLNVMPRFFNPQTTKYASFTRKLNRWGFKQIAKGADSGSFHHRLFIRHRPELCATMQCVKRGDRKFQQLPPVEATNMSILGPAHPNHNPSYMYRMQPPTMYTNSTMSLAGLGMLGGGRGVPPPVDAGDGLSMGRLQHEQQLLSALALSQPGMPTTQPSMYGGLVGGSIAGLGNATFGGGSSYDQVIAMEERRMANLEMLLLRRRHQQQQQLSALGGRVSSHSCNDGIAAAAAAGPPSSTTIKAGAGGATDEMPPLPPLGGGVPPLAAPSLSALSSSIEYILEAQKRKVEEKRKRVEELEARIGRPASVYGGGEDNKSGDDKNESVYRSSLT